MSTVLLLLLAVAAQDLDNEVEHYISNAPPRFSRYDANISVQMNFWMAVTHSTSTIDATDFNLKTELDIGVLNHACEGLYMPSIGGFYFGASFHF